MNFILLLCASLLTLTLTAHLSTDTQPFEDFYKRLVKQVATAVDADLSEFNGEYLDDETKEYLEALKNGAKDLKFSILNEIDLCPLYQSPYLKAIDILHEYGKLADKQVSFKLPNIDKIYRLWLKLCPLVNSNDPISLLSLTNGFTYAEDLRIQNRKYPASSKIKIGNRVKLVSSDRFLGIENGNGKTNWLKNGQNPSKHGLFAVENFCSLSVKQEIRQCDLVQFRSVYNLYLEGSGDYAGENPAGWIIANPSQKAPNLDNFY